MKHFAKKWSKNKLRLHLTIFSKLNAKNWLNFYWNEIKVPHVAQKKLSSNYNQNTNEKLTKIGKKYQNRISICTILWNKITSRYKVALSIGIIKEKLPYWFLTKRRLKDPKNKKLKDKKCQQLTNIAGRLPENSRNRFVDRQSKKQ